MIAAPRMSFKTVVSKALPRAVCRAILRIGNADRQRERVTDCVAACIQNTTAAQADTRLGSLPVAEVIADIGARGRKAPSPVQIA